MSTEPVASRRRKGTSPELPSSATRPKPVAPPSLESWRTSKRYQTQSACEYGALKGAIASTSPKRLTRPIDRERIFPSGTERSASRRDSARRPTRTQATPPARNARATTEALPRAVRESARNTSGGPRIQGQRDQRVRAGLPDRTHGIAGAARLGGAAAKKARASCGPAAIERLPTATIWPAGAAG